MYKDSQSETIQMAKSEKNSICAWKSGWFAYKVTQIVLVIRNHHITIIKD